MERDKEDKEDRERKPLLWGRLFVWMSSASPQRSVACTHAWVRWCVGACGVMSVRAPGGWTANHHGRAGVDRSDQVGVVGQFCWVLAWAGRCRCRAAAAANEWINEGANRRTSERANERDRTGRDGMGAMEQQRDAGVICHFRVQPSWLVGWLAVVGSLFLYSRKTLGSRLSSLPVCPLPFLSSFLLHFHHPSFLPCVQFICFPPLEA